MKALFVKWMVAGMVVALVFPALTSAQTYSGPVDITGNYSLYRAGNMYGNVVGYMRITGQRGNQFSVGIAVPTGDPAQDWKGNGVINGGEGYYDWVFGDGKRGRTTFRIDQAGNLYGMVRGTGVNWDYEALRAEGPIR